MTEHERWLREAVEDKMSRVPRNWTGYAKLHRELLRQVGLE